MTLIVSYLFRFQGKRNERYNIEVRNPSVYIYISYVSGFLLPMATMERFFGALYISLRDHSGYGFKTSINKVQYVIVNCTLNDSCFYYQFYLRLRAHIAVNEKIIQEFLNKDIKIAYKDTNLGFQILEANLTINISSSYRDSLFFWFPFYSLTGKLKPKSEMRDCQILSIVATFRDENQQPDVVTKCTKRLEEVHGLTANGGGRSVNILMTVGITVFISETIS